MADPKILARGPAHKMGAQAVVSATEFRKMDVVSIISCRITVYKWELGALVPLPKKSATLRKGRFSSILLSVLS